LTSTRAIFAILIVQVACAVFFVSDILSSVIGLRSTPISWQLRELIEIGAAVGLVLGGILGSLALRRAHAARDAAEEKLRLASGAFMELLAERFAEWGLTPAERDVALFAIKGMSTAEIAALRNTSEGTVKAQTNAIYRKAGVSGRPQLLSLFIEDLMGEGLPAARPDALPGGGTAPVEAAEETRRAAP
jgi:DNA-binding CsgD family transcriptional regulator